MANDSVNRPGTFDPARTAVLSMDLQTALVSIYVKDAGMMERAAAVLKRARDAGMCVIHVRVGFRPGLPEVSDRNAHFAAIKKSPQHQAIFEGAAGAIHSAVAAMPGEIVITKARVSAFAGTDLALILRAKNIDTLVLFGIATSGVVLSTLLEAGDADYRVAVIQDCCTDRDAELHAALLSKLFPRQAEMLTAAEFLPAAKTAAE